MPIGYGYKESDQAGYVNWAAVTKGFTDVLDADIKDRKKREADYEAQDRQISQTLAKQPLGKFQDGNTFTNNFVDVMLNQRLMDYKLFKSGRLSEKAYRLKTNNAIDGTNTIFDLQKKYQEAAEDRMKGLQEGTYMPLTASNMSLIEGFKDFADSVPVIDPATGIVNISKKKYNDKTKTWEMEYGKTMPVNMAMGLIMNPIKTYDVNGAINKDMEGIGTLADAVYEAANTVSKSVVTSVKGGVEVLKGYPDAAGVVDNFNKALNGKVSEYLSNTLQLASVLSVNVGKYDAESFIYDRDQAAKDPSKILMKIDPTSKYPVMDETAPNFAKQKEEASEWIKTQMLSKIDRERKIDVGSQATDQTYRPPVDRDRGDKVQNEKDVAGSWNRIATATTLKDKIAAAGAVLSSPMAQESGLIGIDLETKPGSAILTYDKPEKNVTKTFTGSSVYDWAALNDFVTTIDRKTLAKYGGGGKTVADLDSYTGAKASRQGPAPKAAEPAPEKDFLRQVGKLSGKLIDTNDDEAKAAENIRNVVSKFPGVTVSGTGKLADYVTVYIDEGKDNERSIEIYTGNKNDTPQKREDEIKRLKDFLEGQDIQTQKILGAGVGAEGLGSKY